MSRTNKSRNYLAGSKAAYAQDYRSSERARVRAELDLLKAEPPKDIRDVCGEPECEWCADYFSGEPGATTESYFDHGAY